MFDWEKNKTSSARLIKTVQNLSVNHAENYKQFYAVNLLRSVAASSPMDLINKSYSTLQN